MAMLDIGDIVTPTKEGVKYSLEIVRIRADSPGVTRYYGKLLGVMATEEWGDNVSLVLPESFEKSEFVIGDIEVPTAQAYLYIEEIGEFAFDRGVPIVGLTVCSYCQTIHDKAFYYNQTIKNLVLKSGLQSIGTYAFAGNNPLETITYNGTTGQFRSVNGLLYDNTETKVILGANGTSGSIVFGSKTKEIGDGAFSYCKQLKSIELPSTVLDLEIGKFAFSDCHKLTTITIPGNLKKVSYGAFFGCYNVTLVDISHGVERLEGLCFGGLPKLRGVDFPNTVDFLETKIGEEPFCGSDRRIVFTLTDEEGSYDEDIKRQLPGDYSGKPVVVTTEVGAIYSKGWTVKFGAPYREVLQAATAAIDSQYGAGKILGWYYDYALTRPIGEEDIVEAVGGHINVYAKTQTCNITLDLCYDGDKDYVLQAPFGYEIVVEDYYTPERKFYNFGGWYADYADGEYSNPKTVDGITRITVMGDATLYAKWVTSSGVYTYEVTDKNEVRLLKVVDWDAVYSPGGIVKIPAYVEMAEYELDSEGNPKLDSSGNPIPVRLPVVAVGSKLFEGVEGVKGIVLPNSLRSIGGRAFSNCINLASLDFEEEDGKVPSLATIGARAFEGAAITTLELPDSVSSIRQGAFLNCQNLESVKFGKKLSDIGTDEGANRGAFEDCEKLEEVRIDTLAHWNSVDFGFSSCNPLSNGASLYVGDSANPITALNSSNLKTRVSHETTVIENGKEKKETTYEEVAATEVKPFAYVGCSSLTTIDLSGTVITKIGEESFSACGALADVGISGGTLAEIGRASFSNLPSMKSLTVPKLTTIGDYAFNGCTGLGGNLGGENEGTLGTLTLNNELPYISKSMFSNCTALTTVTIPASVGEIRASAFSGCTALTSVRFANPSENQCISIGDYTFYACGLVTIGGTGSDAMPLWMETIGNRAFAKNINLQSAILPDGLLALKANVFEDCPSLHAEVGYGGYGYLGNWIVTDKASA